jgi:hypothetical protein
MERWTLHLALHGTLALLVSLVAGLLLHRAIRLDRPVAAWHLAHAGTSGRAVMLIALAAIVHIIVLPPVALAVFVWLMLAFVWTSVAAMVLAAATGDRGLTWSGSIINRTVFALYVASAVTVFPAAFLLLTGLVRALRA